MAGAAPWSGNMQPGSWAAVLAAPPPASGTDQAADVGCYGLAPFVKVKRALHGAWPTWPAQGSRDRPGLAPADRIACWQPPAVPAAAAQLYASPPLVRLPLLACEPCRAPACLPGASGSMKRTQRRCRHPGLLAAAADAAAADAAAAATHSPPPQSAAQPGLQPRGTAAFTRQPSVILSNVQCSTAWRQQPWCR